VLSGIKPVADVPVATSMPLTSTQTRLALPLAFVTSTSAVVSVKSSTFISIKHSTTTSAGSIVKLVV